MSEQPRLADFLDHDKVSLDDVKKKYPSQQFIPTYLLGTAPLSSCYAAINPTSLRIRDVLLPAFLHLPFCDIGRGIDPSLRACIMHAASKAMGCAYCQAHSIGFGSLGGGAELFKEKVAQSIDLDKNGDEFSPAEVVALEMAKAIGSVPSTVTIDHRIDLARHFPETLAEPVVYAAVIMTWLSRFMDTIGVPLEGPAYQNAEGVLGWHPGKHVNEAKDRARMDTEIVNKSNSQGGNSLVNRLVLARHVVGAKIADGIVKRGIPSGISQLNAFMVKEWGFAPYYLSRTQDSGMRSALSFMVIRGFTEEQNPNVPASLKWKLCYLQACRIRSPILRAHFAFLCTRTGTTLEELHSILLSDLSAFDEREHIALKFAELSAGPAPFTMERTEMEKLTALFTSAEVVDLVTTVCNFSTLRASTAAFPPAEYEEGIKEFVEQESIKPLVGYVESWVDWDEVVARTLVTEKNITAGEK